MTHSASAQPGRVDRGGSSYRRCLVLALVLLLAGLSGCGSFWRGVRERERQFSLRHAREQVSRGNCERGLVSLERAQGSAELGDFAAESIWLKARCLARVGRGPEALAHWRMLGDFYPDSHYADSLPDPLALELESFPLAGAREASFSLITPLDLVIPRANYSRVADRYRLAGSVRILYSVDPDGHTSALRVVEFAHPLLAGWALEAIAAAKLEDAEDVPRSSQRAATGFTFSSKWEEQEGEPWIVFFPESDDS